MSNYDEIKNNIDYVETVYNMYNVGYPFTILDMKGDKYPRKYFNNKFNRSNKSNYGENRVLRIIQNNNEVAQYSNIHGNIFDDEDDETKYQYFIFHHIDMDGIFSGAYAREYIRRNFPDRTEMGKDKYISCYSYNYNTNNLKKIIRKIDYDMENCNNPKKICFVVDLSLTSEELEIILREFDNVIWIDHHSTSLTVVNNIKRKEGMTEKFGYIIDTRFCATYITASYLLFNKNCLKDDEKKEYEDKFVLPIIVNAYDLYNKDDKKLFEYGLYMNQFVFDKKILYPNNPIININKPYEFVEKALKTGKILYDLNTQKNKALYDTNDSYRDEYEFEKLRSKVKVHFEGIVGYGNSQVFARENIDDENNVDIKIIMHPVENVNDAVTFSVYTENDIYAGADKDQINLGKVLATFNVGGGHPKACGGTVRFKDSEDLKTIYDIYKSAFKKITTYIKFGCGFEETSNE